MTKFSKMDKIEVPLVQDDLKHDETIIQIAHTLDVLDQAVRNVFDHVKKSIARTRQSLSSIEARNDIVSAKIEQLKTIQKSVTIHSRGKYPYESTRNENYAIDFTVAPRVEPPAACKIVDSESKSQSKKSEPSVDIDNKLKFYHVKTDDMLRRNVELVCEESLGPLPSTIDSITSCLLFNTVDNVYEKYVIMDPLSSGRTKIVQKKGEGDSTPLRKIEDAPKSLNIEDDLLIRSKPYTFSPSVESVPEIMLPTDLPDLVGFADDFRYTEDVEPIVTNVNAAVTLPPQRVDQQPTTAPTASTPSLSSSIPKAPPTPTSQVDSSPPPPPPPLPPPEPPITESTTAVADLSSSLHANLMEAIRSAGGSGKAKLRSVSSDAPNGASTSTTVQAKAPAGDLMSDLAAKLSLRRKGISGSQLKEGGSIMGKLLATIPPPPQRMSSESEESDATEPEWDD